MDAQRPTLEELLDGYDNALKYDTLKKKLTTGKSLKIKRLFNLRGRYFYPASVGKKARASSISRITIVKNTAVNRLNQDLTTVDHAELYSEMCHVVQRQKDLKKRAFVDNLRQLAMLKALNQSSGENQSGAILNMMKGGAFAQQDDDDEDDEDFVPSDDSDEEEEQEDEQENQGEQGEEEEEEEEEQEENSDEFFEGDEELDYEFDEEEEIDEEDEL
ncbi:hypothetical protein CYY_007901 [Polysphondylium violaceum]|uniref:Uncharacterized protein n=1 Tax=Polysphondylium violaceum TaxID=133409 RepID=A0A8J4V1U1_9MYCE|nr:hypothetical protein CYY_007901 [Polysphondylium violaceum]